jgi:hypothetical protein
MNPGKTKHPRAGVFSFCAKHLARARRIAAEMYNRLEKASPGAARLGLRTTSRRAG